MTLIVKFDMFARKQNITVFENKELVERVIADSRDLDNLAEIIINLADKYSISDINFGGPTSYVKRIAEKCYQYEILKYNANKVDIKFI